MVFEGFRVGCLNVILGLYYWSVLGEIVMFVYAYIAPLYQAIEN